MTLTNNSKNQNTQYVVEQLPPPGVAKETKSFEQNPVFKPLKIRGVTLNNRFVVSPMCMYSSKDGFFTDFHLVHYGQYALHGAGLVVIEASGVLPQGRITPSCAGLWSDDHIPGLQRISEYIHNQGGHVGIQLAHAGRKGSTFPPFHPRSRDPALAEDDGWEVDGPSSVAWDSSWLVPAEMSIEKIKEAINAFKEAAIRADKAGIDVVEIHGAHGYLIHEFLSPISNKRTDIYGGTFDNRIRFLVEIVKEVRSVWPKEKPLFVRLSCTDWVDDEPSWTFEETLKLSQILYDNGVDLIDCSSSGSTPKQVIPAAPGFQVPFAEQIRKSIPNLLTGAVGLITTPNHANEIIKDGKGDLIFIAREFLRTPTFVLKAAHELGVNVKYANQYERGRPRPKHEPF